MNVKSVIKAFGAKVYQKRAMIMTITGMAAVVGGTAVIISKATEATDVTYELKSRNRYIREADEQDLWESKKDRSDEVKSMLKCGVAGYTKAYALGISLEITGLVLIGLSDMTMSKELTAANALVASYAATLSKVKDRVIADQGEEKWQEYLLGPQFETVDVLPDGTIIQTTNPLENPNTNAGLPPHCFFFDEGNINWEKSPIQNKNFLEAHQRWLNDRLQAEGFLFENDIRRDLGADLVKCGWTSGIFAKDKDGNINYLKLGLDAKNPAAQRFRDGVEPSIVIQLNVEDNIIDQMEMSLI